MNIFKALLRLILRLFGRPRPWDAVIDRTPLPAPPINPLPTTWAPPTEKRGSRPRVVNGIRVDRAGQYNVSLAPDLPPSLFCRAEGTAGNIGTDNMSSPPIPVPEGFNLIKIKQGKYLNGRTLAVAMRLYRDDNGIWAWERLRNVNAYCGGEFFIIEKGHDISYP